MQLSDQAIGAIMMALQESLMHQLDIVPILKEWELESGAEGLIVRNPPTVKIPEEVVIFTAPDETTASGDTTTTKVAPDIMNKKIIITGTGRCGTTFLVRLFTFMTFKTGFSTNLEHPNSHSLKTPTNPGLEMWAPQLNLRIRPNWRDVHVVKSPYLCEIEHLESLVNDGEVTLEMLIVPIRNSLEVAKSRHARSVMRERGGFRWAPGNNPPKLDSPDSLARAQAAALVQAEKSKCEEVISQFQAYVKAKRLPCIYLDFNQMITDKTYLYQSLAPLLNKYKISKEKFEQSYEQATNLWIKGEF